MDETICDSSVTSLAPSIPILYLIAGLMLVDALLGGFSWWMLR